MQTLGSAHRRFNPLTGDWVLVSPGRLARPWQGEANAAPPAVRPAYDPSCYLCPGNQRANGAHNPAYEQTFVFDNDYAALKPAAAAQPESNAPEDPLLIAAPESGRCRVVCFSPRHDLDIAQMPPEQIRCVIDVWSGEYETLSGQPNIRAVTIFENRGSAMGASNPHPHGQIWANSGIPNELRKEDEAQNAYRSDHGNCLLCEYASRETQLRERVVYEDERLCAVVPFWATWPFELLVIPRAHVPALPGLDDADRDALAQCMHEVTSRYDRLFATPFPYSMGFHQQPAGEPREHWHAHAHYYPPLLRSAAVRKFMVGYELLAQPQRDILPEEAAERLRRA